MFWFVFKIKKIQMIKSGLSKKFEKSFTKLNL